MVQADNYNRQEAFFQKAHGPNAGMGMIGGEKHDNFKPAVTPPEITSHINFLTSGDVLE
jgi:hypothetical protein